MRGLNSYALPESGVVLKMLLSEDFDGAERGAFPYEEPRFFGWGVEKGNGPAPFSNWILCGVEGFLDREIVMRLKLSRSLSTSIVRSAVFLLPSLERVDGLSFAREDRV